MMHVPLSENDRIALHEAAALARDVVDRHPAEFSGPIMVVLQLLVHNVDVLEKLLETS